MDSPVDGYVITKATELAIPDFGYPITNESIDSDDAIFRESHLSRLHYVICNQASN